MSVELVSVEFRPSPPRRRCRPASTPSDHRLGRSTRGVPASTSSGQPGPEDARPTGRRSRRRQSSTRRSRHRSSAHNLEALRGCGDVTPSGAGQRPRASGGLAQGDRAPDFPPQVGSRRGQHNSMMLDATGVPIGPFPTVPVSVNEAEAPCWGPQLAGPRVPPICIDAPAHVGAARTTTHGLVPDKGAPRRFPRIVWTPAVSRRSTADPKVTNRTPGHWTRCDSRGPRRACSVSDRTVIWCRPIR